VAQGAFELGLDIENIGVNQKCTVPSCSRGYPIQMNRKQNKPKNQEAPKPRLNRNGVLVEKLAGPKTTRAAKKLYEKAHYLYDNLPAYQTKGGMLGAYFNPRKKTAHFPEGPKEALGADTGLVREPYVAASSGYLRSGNYFRTAGNPQKNTALSGKGTGVDGIRFHFRESSAYRIRTDATPHTSTVLTNDGGLTYTGGIGIGLTNVGPKLAVLGTMYGWYAYRDLTLTYVPACPSNTAGLLSLSLDMNMNIDSLSAGLTQEQVLEHECAGGTTVWNPMSIRIKFNGTKLWSTTSLVDTAALSEFFQFQLYAAMSTVPAGGQFGSLVFSGIVDFYEMSQIHTANPVLDEQEVWNKFCHEKWLKFLLSTPEAERIKFPEFLKRYRDKIISNERRRYSLTDPGHHVAVMFDPDKACQAEEKKKD
jgi:hypothetical protein